MEVREDSGMPPEDPDDWTHEQWLAWLSSTDAEAGVETQEPSHPSRPRSTSSRLLYAGMLGLYQAIYGAQPEQPTIVVEADGDPAEPESLEVHLEPDHPEESSVIVRTWLLHPDEQGPDR